MGKRTGRPKGAPKGNRNRWVHGFYSGQERARRQKLDQLIAECDRIVAWALAVHTRRQAAAAQAAKLYFYDRKFNIGTSRTSNIANRSQQCRFPARFDRKNLHRPRHRMQMSVLPEAVDRPLFFPGRKYNAYQPQEVRR